jgi:hypothetical protein
MDCIQGNPGAEAIGFGRTAEDEEVQACAEACSRANVAWEGAVLDGTRGVVLPATVTREDLLVFDQRLSAVQKQDLFRQARRNDGPAILLCPTAWLPLTRALVVDQRDTFREGYLRWAVGYCRGLGTDPIVLTIARTERTARLRQAVARETLAEAGLTADFDFLVGAETRMAVARIARWRRCQLVILQRQDSPPWWRWLRDTYSEWMTNWTETLSFLSLPGPGVWSLTLGSAPMGSPASREFSFASPPASRPALAAKEPPR